VPFDASSELAAYRAAVRDWLERHAGEAPHPHAARDAAPEAEHVARRRAWQARLADAGWLGAAWPADAGGRGLTPAHAAVVEQELEAAGVPGAFDVVGIGMVAPTIIAHGSPAQRSRHLPPLLRADEVWCQLFSEPGAGSDLAAVATSARSEPDGNWRVSGQKMWTSHAQHAAFGLMLARTDISVPKHHGLTMFVVPMDAVGITIRPLRQISGATRFSEVFLDDVRLGADAVVGDVGGGWRVAVGALSGERSALSRTAESLSWPVETFAAALASVPSAVDDPDVQRRFGEIACELLALRWRRRQAAERPPDPVTDPAAALDKVTAVAAATRAGDLLCDVLGPAALEDEEWGRMVSDLPGLRSAGGTDEIIRTVVGERALGLPPEPRVDRDIPFDRLPEPGLGTS